MQRSGLAALSAMIFGCAPVQSPIVTTANEQFQLCPGASSVLAQAANLTWQPVPSAIEKHRQLRTRQQRLLPEGKYRVLLFNEHRHHTSHVASVVAVKRDGLWTVDLVGEDGPGLLPMPIKALPHQTYSLSAADSARMDEIVSDPCLFAAPTFQLDPNIASGGTHQTLEIQTPNRSWIGAWLGSRTAQQDELVKLLVKQAAK